MINGLWALIRVDINSSRFVGVGDGHLSRDSRRLGKSSPEGFAIPLWVLDVEERES